MPPRCLILQRAVFMNTVYDTATEEKNSDKTEV